MEGTQRALVTASMLYLFSASTGARIAIDEDISACFLGNSSPNMPQEDFVHGFGTALSPGVKMLAAQTVLTFLASRRGPLGKWGAAALSIYGLAALAGMLGERITYTALHPRTFDPPKATVVILNILLPAAMALLGVSAARGDR
jgi:hypothetical protein